MEANKRGHLTSATRTKTEAQYLANDVLPPLSTFNVEKGKPHANMAALEDFAAEDNEKYIAEITQVLDSWGETCL